MNNLHTILTYYYILAIGVIIGAIILYGVILVMQGFTLPVVTLASIVMLMALSSTGVFVSSVVSYMDKQYYDDIASDAAQLGITAARNCVDEGKANWDKPLVAADDCGGSVSGCEKSSCYIVDKSNGIRTSFSVAPAQSLAGGAFIQADSTGVVERVDKSGRVRRSSSVTIRSQIGVSLTTTYSAAGFWQVCGIISDETWCWGDNTYGQLGDGTLDESAKPVKALRSDGLAGKKDTNISIGNSNVCMVSSGDVYCWGKNNAGQMGIGSSDTNSHAEPVNISNLHSSLRGKTATKVTVNSSSSCAIVAGDFYCWGSNWAYQFGNGNSTSSSTPVRGATIGASRGLPVTDISSSVDDLHKCAIAAGRVYCWGSNSVGQLGDDTTTDRASPVRVYQNSGMSGKTFTKVVTGGGVNLNSDLGRDESHSCAISSSGELYCWGSNYVGQIGNGTHSATLVKRPQKIGGALSGKTVTDVSAGYMYTCAVADGEAYCWGDNAVRGQLGDGTRTNRDTPTPVKKTEGALLGKTVTAVTSNANHSCAIAGLQTYCWGANSKGQLGTGYITQHSQEPLESVFLRPHTKVVYY